MGNRDNYGSFHYEEIDVTYMTDILLLARRFFLGVSVLLAVLTVGYVYFAEQANPAVIVVCLFVSAATFVLSRIAKIAALDECGLQAKI